MRNLPRADLALAGALSAYAIVEALLLRAPADWLLAGLAATIALAWRRRHPAAVIAFVLVVIFAPGALGTDTVESVLPLPLIIVCGFTAGSEAPTGRAALLGALAVVALATLGQVAAPVENTTAEDAVALAVLVGGSAAAGRAMRVRQAENRRLRELTARLAAEQDLHARAAVAEERARVARELHDIVAHSVSLIAVQAGAAEQLMGRDDDRARASLRAVQETASGALGEMRRLLGVLRADGDAPGLAPQPGLTALGELVEQARGSGLPVELHVAGERPEIAPGVDLSAYRIVQEALTNVRRHAGAVPTEVRVRYAPDAVDLEVANADAGPRSGNGNGHGLTGMRERARIYGGTLDVARGEGRFVVRARLPLTGRAE
jgi:signal transduction histidine kinase